MHKKETVKKKEKDERTDQCGAAAQRNPCMQKLE